MFTKKVKHSIPSARGVVFATLLCLLLAVSFSAGARRPDRPAQPLKQDEDCLACHGDKELKDQTGHSVYVDHPRQKESVHGSLGCTDCHATIKGFPHPEHPQPVSCGTCHAGQTQEVDVSVHKSASTLP